MLPVVYCIGPEQQKTFFEIFVAPILSTLIGTVAGALFGGYVSYRFGLLLAERKSFNTSAANLRRAFLDELLKLEAGENIDTYNILAPALNKHQAAVFEFRQILSSTKSAAFDTAWKEYYYGTEQQEIPFLEQYADLGNLNKRKIYRHLAIDRIRTILSFTEKNK
ncbi:MAG: hypothetical protein F9K48_07770 [Candidatus Brocadia sp.]|nr:MAG: hypothetical protein F9K48_07770 [Candidatus Brocadia sp.]